MSDEAAFARAYQALGEYFCAFSALDRVLGQAVKVVLDLDRHPAGDFVVAALEDPARKANLVLAAVAVAKNADGSIRLTKQNLRQGQLKGEPKTWKLEDKIKETREITKNLQRITADLGTLTISIPDLGWLVPLSEPIPPRRTSGRRH